MLKTTLPVKIHPPIDQQETRNLLSTHQRKQVSLQHRLKILKRKHGVQAEWLASDQLLAPTLQKMNPELT